MGTSGNEHAGLSRSVPAPSLRYLPLRWYYDLLDTWRARDPEQLRATIAVVGSPRSGTTWLGDVVAALASRPLLHEPTHVNRIPEFNRDHGWDGRPFREPGVPDEALARDLERLITGTYLGAGMIQRSPSIDRALWARAPLVTKMIDVNLLLPWLAGALPWLTTVLIVRHPLAVVASQQARADSVWAKYRTLSLSYQRFMAAHPEYDGPLEYDTVEERLTAAWAIEHAWLRDRAEDLGRLVQVRYEDIRAEPQAGVRALAAALSLPEPSPTVLERALRPSRSVNEDTSTLGGGADDGWRSAYDARTVDRLIPILDHYGFPFYGPEALGFGDG